MRLDPIFAAMKLGHRLAKQWMPLCGKVIFLVSVKLQGVDDRHRNRERRLPQAQAVNYLALRLQPLAPIIDRQSG